MQSYTWKVFEKCDHKKSYEKVNTRPTKNLGRSFFVGKILAEAAIVSETWFNFTAFYFGQQFNFTVV